MKVIDRENIKLLRTVINEVLEEVGKKHDLKIEVGSGSFSPTNATLKISISILNPDGTSETLEQNDYKLYAKSFGLEPNWLDKDFTTRWPLKRYKILGLLPNSRKYPVLCRCLKSGKEFKLQIHSVVEGMKNENPIHETV